MAVYGIVLYATDSNGVGIESVHGLPEPELDLLVGWGVFKVEVLAPVPHTIMLHRQTYTTRGTILIQSRCAAEVLCNSVHIADLVET